MRCPKCGSGNVVVQAVGITKTKGHGLLWWCGGCLIDLFFWIVAFVPRLFVALFRGRKIKTKVRTFAVCQQCGRRWRA